MRAGDFVDLAASLGSPAVELPRAGDLGAWYGHAGTRRAFQLWGKARDGHRWPLHPLACHVLDVAAVAARMIATVLGPALRGRLLGIDDDPERAFRALLFVVAAHDFGKLTPAFQAKREDARAPLTRLGFDLDGVRRKDRHHGDIGFPMLSPALKGLGAEPWSARALARAVVAHHGELPLDAAGPADPRQLGRSAAWGEARSALLAELATHFGVSRPVAPSLPRYDHGLTVTLAGLTSVADWVGSMDEVFQYEAPPPSLASYWTVALDRAERALARAGLRARATSVAPTFRGLFPPYSPWPLHEVADRLAAELDSPSLVIVEAPMGEGKTETALLLATSNEARADQRGFFIGLPTQATANQMFGRVQSFLERVSAHEVSLLLAHGEASLVERFRDVRLAAIYDREDGRGRVRAEEWFLTKKRTLLADHAVGTVDQALLSVMRVGHGFVRVFGLAGKTVILDEVHAYDTYTSKLLDRLVEWLAAVGASVVLLSATLPSSRRRALSEAYARGRGLGPSEVEPAPYPRVSVTTGDGTRVLSFVPRRPPLTVELSRVEPTPEAMVEAALSSIEGGGCAGCVFNTVARAQQAYRHARALRPDLDRLLLHARLLPDDRLGREEQLARWLGPAGERPERVLVIGTQVLEQSLDVDFDVLFSDLAPIDLVLQRAGRLFRHDRADRSPNQTAPRLVVARPAEPDESVFDEVAGVYSRLIVARSFEALRPRTAIVLPTDIEPLVEQVYDDRVIPEPDSPDYHAFLEHHGAALVHASLAGEKLLPSPKRPRDILSDFKVFLREEDGPEVHAQLRAATRLGPPSVDVVCLEQGPDGPRVGATPVDLDAEPSPALTALLARLSIGVTRRGLVEALVAQPTPSGWKMSALLRHRRPVVFMAGRAEIGGTVLELDRELGLVLSSKETS